MPDGMIDIVRNGVAMRLSRSAATVEELAKYGDAEPPAPPARPAVPVPGAAKEPFVTREMRGGFQVSHPRSLAPAGFAAAGEEEAKGKTGEPPPGA